MAKDGKFVYSIMEVLPGAGEAPTPGQIYLSRQLLADSHPLLPEYYQRVLHGVRLTTEGMRRSEDTRLPDYEQLLTELEALEVQIYGNRC